jgi:3D (Asp-Asp-Asp) domain-containing protein
MLVSAASLNAEEPIPVEPQITERECRPATVSETAGVSREIPIETVENVETSPIVEEVRYKWISAGDFTLTAYCSCEKCCGYWATVRPVDEYGNQIVYTASGEVAKPGVTVAVDTTMIPFGTELRIGDHVYIAQDTGNAITGSRIDVYFDNHQEAWEFGIQTAEVFVKGVK